jgi:hypothetical protein
MVSTFDVATISGKLKRIEKGSHNEVVKALRIVLA